MQSQERSVLSFNCRIICALGRSAVHAYSVCFSCCAASALRGTGLNLGVATMCKGELCRLDVASEYGYGDKGNCLVLDFWEARLRQRLAPSAYQECIHLMNGGRG